jgi:hypothetical protein
MADPIRPDQATRDAEREDARRSPGSDRMPTAEEAERADELELDDDVAAHEREMQQRGADQQGEGRLP